MWSDPVAAGASISRRGCAAMLLNMQRTHGNRAVQRFLNQASSSVQIEDLGDRIQKAARGGEALDLITRKLLEGALGAELSAVRVHTDKKADELCRGVDAVAFTSGQDIFFREGKHEPATSEGLRLLAHEAAHTVQQSLGPVDGTPMGDVMVSEPTDRFEKAADAAAEEAIGGKTSESTSVLPGTVETGKIQRQEAEPDREDTGGSPTSGSPDLGAEGSGPGGNEAGGSPLTPIDAEIERRRAERDSRFDEYGIEKPPISWTEKLVDWAAPEEIMNDPSTSSVEQLGRGFLAAPASFAGHVFDEISPFNTRGEIKLPVPILGELAHAEEESRYERKREAYEEQLREDAARVETEQTSSTTNPYAPTVENLEADTEENGPPAPFATWDDYYASQR
jgi:hypothetical protein